MNTTDNIKDRFKELLKILGIGQKAFEIKCGMGNGTINNIKNGISSPNLEKIISTYPEINIEWIISGKGTPLKKENENIPKISYTKGVPYYNVDFIGGFDIIENNQTANPEYYIDFRKYNTADCWCNVTGHSMEPEITHGDIIALKELHDWQTFIPSGEIYGIVTPEHRTIKKVSPSTKEGFIRLIPTNPSPEYVSQDIPLSIVLKVYKVLGCMKRL